jgi:tyrosyl-tRNA synthetase
MYGKIMSVPDSLVWKYFTYLTRIPLKEIETLSRQVKAETAHPRDIKMALAREIVSFFHTARAAEESERAFIRVFQERKNPREMPVIMIAQKQISLLDLVMAAKLAASKAEARRVIKQGGLSINGKTKTDPHASIALSPDGSIVKKGKRHFVKILSA